MKVGASMASPMVIPSSGTHSSGERFASRTFRASVKPFEWRPELSTPITLSPSTIDDPSTMLSFFTTPTPIETRSKPLTFSMMAVSPPTIGAEARLAPSTSPFVSSETRRSSSFWSAI